MKVGLQLQLHRGGCLLDSYLAYRGMSECHGGTTIGGFMVSRNLDLSPTLLISNVISSQMFTCPSELSFLPIGNILPRRIKTGTPDPMYSIGGFYAIDRHVSHLQPIGLL